VSIVKLAESNGTVTYAGVVGISVEKNGNDFD
jgi:hypothetical protein